MRHHGRSPSCPRCAELERKVREVEAALEATRSVLLSGEASADVAALSRLPSDDDPLTTREWEILTLLALGRSNQAIADELYLSINTVKTHVQHAYRKVGVSNRVEAAVWLSGHRADGAGREHATAMGGPAGTDHPAAIPA